jgi:hypothetical protein
MLSISLIILFSVVLFVYWFRYSCLLILQNRTAYGAEAANAPALSLPAVRERLRTSDSGVVVLDQLHRDLTNDYRIICFLLRCSAEKGVDPIERRLLMVDYWMMQAWFNVSRRAAPVQARKALEEISSIVGYLACSVGRHAAQSASASA